MVLKVINSSMPALSNFCQIIVLCFLIKFCLMRVGDRDINHDMKNHAVDHLLRKIKSLEVILTLL